jgi:uncharacterized protein YijF (DUF1287 family)
VDNVPADLELQAESTRCHQESVDYPDIFTPYPKSWDEKRREKAHELWRRINELRAYHDRQGFGWQFQKVDELKAETERDIASWEEYRAEVEAGVNIKKRETIPRIVSNVNTTINELNDEIGILADLRKHLEKTLGTDETK